MYQLNMTQVAIAFNVNYDTFRKYVDAIRKRYPNFASGGKFDVREMGYIAIFLNVFKTAKGNNKTMVAVEAVDNAIKNDIKPFIR